MEEQKNILVVDDTPANITAIRELLKKKYRVKVATNGSKALEIALNEKKPDLILLDIMMPEMDGYEVCKLLKASEVTRDIPVIFLTAKTDIENEAMGLALGAVDYIAKPISPPIVLERVKTHLAMKKTKDKLKNQNEVLELMVEQRTRQMGELQDVTMVAMGALAETRDPETGNHIRRTRHYVKLLAERLKGHPRFNVFLTPGIITLLYKISPLHDIGKVGVPDHILLKPGKLSAAEFEEIKKHTTYGRDAIAAAESSLQESDNFLSFAKEIAYSHQEKWDGSGYPEGLAGDDIPISARLMAVADVYDALISHRVYKNPMKHEEAVSVIAEGSGSHFDPDMVNAFLEISDKFRDIAQQYGGSQKVLETSVQ